MTKKKPLVVWNGVGWTQTRNVVGWRQTWNVVGWTQTWNVVGWIQHKHGIWLAEYNTNIEYGWLNSTQTWNEIGSITTIGLAPLACFTRHITHYISTELWNAGMDHRLFFILLTCPLLILHNNSSFYYLYYQLWFTSLWNNPFFDTLTTQIRFSWKTFHFTKEVHTW